MTAAPPAAIETGQTRFYIFTASDDLATFTYVGIREARDRDHALRLEFGSNPPLSVAVSEHAWKVRKPRVEQIVRGLTDVQMPVAPAAVVDEPPVVEPSEAEE